MKVLHVIDLRLTALRGVVESLDRSAAHDHFLVSVEHGNEWLDLSGFRRVWTAPRSLSASVLRAVLLVRPDVVHLHDEALRPASRAVLASRVPVVATAGEPVRVTCPPAAAGAVDLLLGRGDYGYGVPTARGARPCDAAAPDAWPAGLRERVDATIAVLEARAGRSGVDLDDRYRRAVAAR